MEGYSILVEISVSLVTGGTSGYVIFRFLGQKWIERWFSKDLEKYKQQLDLLKMQKQLQFSNIYIERATIIKELYILLGELIKRKHLINEYNLLNKDQENSYYTEYYNLLIQLYNYNMKNSIYLPDSTADKLAKFAETIAKEITIKQHEHGAVTDDYLNRIKNIPDNDLPLIFRSLKADFQELLGIESVK